MQYDLETALLDAHARGDRAALVPLYTVAADQADSEDAQAFFLTHAMVFALEIGAPEANDLRQRLASMGREASP